MVNFLSFIGKDEASLVEKINYYDKIDFGFILFCKGDMKWKLTNRNLLNLWLIATY